MSLSHEDKVRGTSEDAATALLGQLKSLDDRPKKPGELGRASMARAACNLLEDLAFVGEPAGPALRELFAHLLRVPHDGAFLKEYDEVPTNDPEAWWRAIDFEAAHPPDESGTNPSTATVSGTARAAGKGRKLIRDWRSNERYRREVDAARWARRVGARIEERKS